MSGTQTKIPAATRTRGPERSASVTKADFARLEESVEGLVRGQVTLTANIDRLVTVQQSFSDRLARQESRDGTVQVRAVILILGPTLAFVTMMTGLLWFVITLKTGPTEATARENEQRLRAIEIQQAYERGLIEARS